MPNDPIRLPVNGAKTPAQPQVLPAKSASRMSKWRFELKVKGAQQAVAGYAQADTLANAVLKVLAVAADNDVEFDGILIAVAETPSGIVLPG